MAKELITVTFYKEGVVKRKDGTSVTRKDGTPFEKGELVGVTEGQYPRTICFTVIKDDVRFACKSLQPNDRVDVTYDVESREWSGKYFTEAKAWGVETKTPAPQPTMGGAPIQNDIPDDGDSDLPF